MKKMKKSISMMLIVAMLAGIFAMCGMTSFAHELDIDSHLWYEISDGEIVITGCDVSFSGDIIIPDTIGGYPVTTIGEFAFNSCRNITSIIIPDSVTTINNLAFDGCTRLESVIIPDSVITIGIEVFYYCPSLKNITVDKNNNCYSSNEDGVLFDKDKTKLIAYPAGSSRTEYVIPDSVRSIDNSAFFGATNLKKIIIPDGVETISGAAFGFCCNLEEIIIPDSVTSTIGVSTFYACANLENVIIGNGVVGIESHAFYNCVGLEKVKIGNGVTFIESYAFGNDGSNNLKSITIPENVETIGIGAFSSCNALTEINILNPELSINKIGFGYKCMDILIDNDEFISMEKKLLVCSVRRELTHEEPDDSDHALTEEFISSYIMLDGFKIIENALIYGYKDSTAEIYATENNMGFAELGQKITPDEEENPIVPETPTDIEDGNSENDFFVIISKLFERIADFFTQIFSSLKNLFA